jgi:hypothetical protein
MPAVNLVSHVLQQRAFARTRLSAQFLDTALTPSRVGQQPVDRLTLGTLHSEYMVAGQSGAQLPT